MKILAVGMNYAKHNKELDGTLYKPEEPVIFAKPDSALLKDGKPFFIPDFTKQCDYETELVIRICRLGKNIAPRFAYRYYDAVTVGIDFTARDLQRKFRKEGLPWELCKGFDSSAVVGDFVSKEELPDIQQIPSIWILTGIRCRKAIRATCSLRWMNLSHTSAASIR